MNFQPWLTRLVLLVSAIGFATASKAADRAQTTDTANRPSESEIAKIVMTADQAEITTAKLAERKAKNKDVKAFARHMVTDHTANEKDDEKIEKTLKLKPTESAASTDLAQSAKQKTDNLKSMKGSDFDKAYVDLQVAMHEQLLSDLEQKFIPSATSTEMKTFLESTKDHVQKHLELAQKLQTSLR